MGKKKIKHLGRYNKSRRKIKKSIKKFMIIFGVTVCLIGTFLTTNHLEELYKKKDIEKSKIEYYMNIADEVGEFKTQINWKELMAIDMVINSKDLSSIRKKDSMNIAKKFLNIDKVENDSIIYSIKPFENVLEELKFNEQQKKDANKYNQELEYEFLGGKILDENSEEILFINKIENLAIDNYKNYKILPSITIGQCILESGWGKSELSLSSNNLFGIKADKSWMGKSIEVSTIENYDDKINASFRVYKSIGESIEDHGKFLIENKRYAENGLFEASHYTTQAKSLEDAGYSTKEDEKGERIYADILINLIRNYNLQLIDSKVQKKVK